jgi:hypothetical protein
MADEIEIDPALLMEDMRLLTAIKTEADPVQLLAKLVDYHRNTDRTDRTSKVDLFHQVGALMNACRKLLMAKLEADRQLAIANALLNQQSPPD